MENLFDTTEILDFSEFPLEDSLSAKAWAGYVEEILGGKSVIEVLRENLINLRFPIGENIKEEEAYKDAIYKGKEPLEENPLEFTEEKNIRIYLYNTIAGQVPIIEFKETIDFKNMVRALVYKNGCRVIPDSMGACLVKNYNNWGRIKELKNKCEKENKVWIEEFRRIKEKPELYKDNILLLSNKFYSNVSSKIVGGDDNKWREYSLKIRREHEVTHFITLKLFKSAKNNIHDEIIADYMGIVKAFGEYKADYFLNFMGLLDYPRYRAHGRLENYMENYMEYIEIMKLASENIERLAREYGKDIYSDEGSYKMLCALVRTDINDIAYNYKLLRGRIIENE